MSNIIEAQESDWKDICTDKLYFEALTTRQEGMYNVLLKDKSQRRIIGQTSLNRHYELFKSSISLLHKHRPDISKKRVGSFPMSMGAEMASVVACAKHLGIQEYYEYEGVDIQPEFVEHARSFRFPKGMLYGKPGWLRSAFRETADSDWVEANPDVQDAITIHPSADLKTYKGDKPYDIIFINSLLCHLSIEQSFYVLMNLLPQSNGLIGITGKLFRRQQGEGSDAPEGIAALFHEHGFAFVSPNEKEIVLSDDFSKMSHHKETGAYIAIHPQLAAEMR